MHADIRKLYRILLVTIVLVASASGAWAASGCDVYRELAQSNASDDFWQELAELGANPSPTQLQALMQKHNVKLKSASDAATSAATTAQSAGGASQTASGTAAARATTLKISRTAEADLRNIRGNPVLFEKAQEFMRVAEDGFQAVYNHPHSKAGWSLKAVTSGYGHGHYSIRLTGGYRVLFYRESDNSIKILEMSKDATHG